MAEKNKTAVERLTDDQANGAVGGVKRDFRKVSHGFKRCENCPAMIPDWVSESLCADCLAKLSNNPDSTLYR